MSIFEFFLILKCWLFFILLTFIGYPFFFLIFGGFKDRGYFLAKPLCLAVIAYMAWLLPSLHIAPFSSWVIWLILIGGIILSIKRLKEYPVIKDFILQNWKDLIITEIIFASILTIFTVIRGFTPEIINTEKPMEYAFLNGILESRFFPPQDPWYAPFSINYYYFGIFITAFLSKAIFIKSCYIFNLSLPIFYALTGVLLWGISKKLLGEEKNFWGGIFAIFTVIVFGNWEAFKYLTAIFKNGFNILRFNWWEPSRVIPNTINEFPFFSILLGDLHPHVIAIFLFFLFIAFLIEIINYEKLKLPILLLTALLSGIIFTTNPWNLITLFFILIIVFIYRFLKFNINTFNDLVSLIFIFVFTIALFIPYFKVYDSNFQGIIFKFTYTPLPMILRHFGLFIIIMVASLPYWINRYKEKAEVPFKDDEVFVLIFIATGFLQIIGCDFFYIKDYFSDPYHRMNTVFKFYYTSWLLFGLATTFVIVKSKSLYQGFKKIIWNTIVIVSITLSLIYPIFGGIAKSYHKNSKWTLNGETFLTKQDPLMYETIEYIREKIPPKSIVLEQVDKAYSMDNLVSAFTGRPTIVGWEQHEALWRGGWDEVSRRKKTVQAFYDSAGNEIFDLLNKHAHIDYILIDINKPFNNDIQKYGEIVFKNNGFILIKVNRQ